MSEKRFIIVKSIENLYALVDKEREGKEQILIFSLHKEQLGVVCDLLNEQQDIIKSKDSLLSILAKENEQLRKQVAEYELILRQHEFAEKEGFR